MTLIVAWVVFPLVLAVLALGCGLLLQRVSGVELRGALLLPCGLAVIVVTAGLATITDATAQLATLASHRYAPYPEAAELPPLGPIRRVVRSVVLAVRERRRGAPEEELEALEQ